LLPPVGFGGGHVLLGEPFDVAPKRLDGRRRRLLAAAERLAGSEDFVQDQPYGATVHHSMVGAQDEAPARVGHPEERHPDERRPRQIEPALPVRLQKGLEELLLLVRRVTAPVLLVPFEGRPAMHLLYGPLATLPAEAGAEDGVAVDDVLPGAPKRHGVQLLRQGGDELEDLDPGVGRERAVEEHPFLQWR